MKTTRQEKGITLIALIITIVVLLILAAVVIRAVQGDGIIEYAKNARDDYEQAQANEQAMLDNYIAQIEGSLNDESVEVTHSGIIPEGGTYIQGWEAGFTYNENGTPISWGLISEGITYTAGQAFPAEVQEGDIYIYGDYEYRYNYVYSTEYEGNGKVNDRVVWQYYTEAPNPGNSVGWAVKVTDKTKTSYKEIPASINGENVTNMYATYSGSNIATLPTIPNTVTSLCSSFASCKNITNLSNFIIPDGVICMNDTFGSCGTLDVSGLVIPENVTDIMHMLGDCTSVTGTVKLHCRFMGQSVQDDLAWTGFSETVEYYHLEGCSH